MRVVVVNQDWWSAGPFTVRVRILSATPVVRNFTLSGLAKNSSAAFDAQWYISHPHCAPPTAAPARADS